MKTINKYIIEKLKIGKTTKQQYTCHPKDRDELYEILKERLAKDKNANLNDIDVSEIEDMSFLFDNLDPHDIDISQWDVSKVKDMLHMFAYCPNFNCDLSNWDVSNVEDMWAMFEGCHSLTNIPSWYKE